jgi:predicted  nucleic acid-binding Zn-ribbon protein
MSFRYVALAVVLPSAACAVQTHRAATYEPMPPAITRASDVRALDAEISSVDSRIGSLELQMTSLDTQLSETQSTSAPGREGLLGSTQARRDALREEISSLRSKRNSLQILRNSL